MYRGFFGLRERPFDITPNTRYLYLTKQHAEALSHLRYGLASPRGFTLLLGDAGTGKTTIVKAALDELRDGTVQYLLLSNPTLTRQEFLEFLASGFNLSPECALSKTRLLAELGAHLEARHAAGLLTALVLDEAQSLSHELLEEVRLLGNIESPTAKMLNIILAGQPELADRLNEPALRQLKQRVSLRCRLEPFSVTDTAAYLAGRLRIAGGTPAEIFSREAVTAIHEYSKGIPRTINVLADNALISGFAAQVRPVPRSIVLEVTRDFDVERAGSPAAADAQPSPTAAPVPPEEDRAEAEPSQSESLRAPVDAGGRRFFPI